MFQLWMLLDVQFHWADQIIQETPDGLLIRKDTLLLKNPRLDEILPITVSLCLYFGKNLDIPIRYTAK